MGLTKFCADHGAHITVDYGGDKAILNCEDDYHSDSLWFDGACGRRGIGR